MHKHRAAFVADVGSVGYAISVAMGFDGVFRYAYLCCNNSISHALDSHFFNLLLLVLVQKKSPPTFTAGGGKNLRGKIKNFLSAKVNTEEII